MDITRALGTIAALGLVSAALAQTPAGTSTSDSTADQSKATQPTTTQPESGAQSTPSAEQPSGATSSTSAASETSPTPGTSTPAATVGADDAEEISEAARTARSSGSAAASGGRLASELIGSEVLSSKDPSDEIGEIEDVIIDRSGRITHALVSYGGTLGFGEKLTAVPWDTVSSSMRENRVVLDRSRLEAAPTLSEEQVAQLATATEWRTRADQHWMRESERMRAAEAPPMEAPPTGAPPTGAPPTGAPPRPETESAGESTTGESTTETPRSDGEEPESPTSTDPNNRG